MARDRILTGGLGLAAIAAMLPMGSYPEHGGKVRGLPIRKADTDKKAARKAQKKARAITRKARK
jgi:hypothetical protein